jgi:hypothetical protein
MAALKSKWYERVFNKMDFKSSIRYSSARHVFGKPLVDIAWGPDKSRGETYGHAKGFIAIGQMASGPIAIGIISYGILSFGLLSLGIISFSWIMGLGVVTFSGLAFGIIAFGGAAFGFIALGGMAVGYLAIGGFAIGQYALGGFAIGRYILSATHSDPEVFNFINQYAPWLIKSFEKPN